MKSLLTSIPNAANIIQRLPSPSALLNNNLELVDASPSWLNTFGFKRNAVIGQSVSTIFPTFSDSWTDSLEYALEGLDNISFNNTFDEGVCKRQLAWNINPWKDGYGGCIGVVLNVTVTNKEKPNEKRLSKINHLLNSSSIYPPLACWEYTVANDKVYWSREVKQLFSVDATTEATSLQSLKFFKGAEGIKLKKALIKATKQGVPWNFNVQATIKNNKTIWLNSIGRPKFAQGKCLRIIGSFQEITNDYKLISLLKTPETDILEALPLGGAVLDLKNGTIANVNTLLEELIGLTRKELLGRHFTDFFPMSKNEMQKLFKHILANEGFSKLDKKISTGNTKTMLTLRFNGKFLSANNKRTLLVSCEDVSALYNNVPNTGLADSYQQFDKIMGFNGLIAQNLKASASNIDLLLKFLAVEKNLAKQKELMAMLQHSSQGLSTNIQDLKEVVGIREHIKKDRLLLFLNDFVYQAIEEKTDSIKTHEIKIHNEVLDDLKVMGNPIYLKNIIANLISCSISLRNNKKKAIILIHTEKIDGATVLCVEGNGMGIAPNEKEDTLKQLYATLETAKNPSGMDLYLAKYQTELMGGKFEFTSDVKKGTTFKVCFAKA